jgi:signal transduction histidine kinase
MPQQRIAAERGIAIGVAVALLLQSVNGYLAYQAATDYVQASQERRQSLQVLLHSEELLTLMRDAETGQRGFLLTGDESYLEPYRGALAKVRTVRKSFADAATPSHGNVVDEIDLLIDEQLVELGETIELRRNDSAGGAGAAAKRIQTGTAKQTMDRLRKLIGDLEEDERARLGNVTARMDRLASLTPPRVLAVSSLAVVLVGGVGWIAYRDVRRRAAAEKKIREQRRILDSVLDNITDGVLVADASGRLQLINQAAKRMHGQDGTTFSRDEWNRRFGLYRIDGQTLMPIDELPLVRTLRGEEVEQAELYLKPPNAETGLYLGINGRPLRNDEGRLQGGVIVLRDITRQKQAELRDQEIREELERLVMLRTADLRQINFELQQKNLENETFVYSVSHDLRSPLVNLQGFSQELSLACEDLKRLLSEADVPAAVRSRGLAVLQDDFAGSIRFIQTAVLRLADIINALLKLSRAGRVDYQLQDVPVRQIVGRVVDTLQAELNRRGAAVEIGELPSVWGDPLAIEQIFANLLDNAVKYLDPVRSGRITVISEPTATSGMNTFVVRDNGLGLPEMGREKVFKAFERFHPSHAPGDGMGLAIVRRIVERHNGTIHVESSPGVGTAFFITLPAAASSVS